MQCIEFCQHHAFWTFAHLPQWMKAHPVNTCFACLLVHAHVHFCIGCAEIGQAKASDKDIDLAWQRIEAFLLKFVDPRSAPCLKTNDAELAPWEQHCSNEVDHAPSSSQQEAATPA